ncbi:hypothetical protein KZ829_40475 [Actinoplanes hulinensis]|uniref:Integral membrane protein n=1 Tax=Actinoplanes hulinensis TaxID=1144547 RepID=A0ABS7BGK6_9ACTN|nr:hypothetical protein [Actinoplanes hulinensis]MBW6440019.1 hypothetical protein [Actinoplanes hulinensis]
MIIVYALAEGGLAAMGVVAWQSYRDGDFTTVQAGPFTVMGASAAIGAILAILAVIALLRGGRGQGLARGTLNLTWLRLGAVLIALAVIALTVGVSVAGIFGMVLALGDALAGFVVTGAVARRTRGG